MIWKIAKKEFLLNLMTFKFAVGTILCVVLMAVFIPVLVSHYQQRLKTYNDNVTHNKAELNKVRVYKNITPTIYRLPSVLSIFSQGVEKELADSAEIVLYSVPEINAAATKGNPYLSIFSVFDASLIFKIVISILALLVSYDVISGEREQGTLKLIIAGTISRSQVLLGKLLAGLMTLTVPVTIAFIVGLMILLSFPMIDLTPSDWIRIGLMYLATLIFISAMYNVGLLFSSLTRKSAISLVLGLFVWIVFVVVIPNGSVHLAQHIRPLKPEEKMKSQVKLIVQKRNSELREVMKNVYSSWAETTGRGAFNGRYPLVCNKSGMEYYNKRSILQEPVKIKYAGKLWEVQHNYLRDLFEQKSLADNISRISPIFLYERLMSALAGTDLASFRYFMERVKVYRNKTIDYIRSKTDNFSSISYFTRSTEQDWEEHNKILEPYRQAREVMSEADKQRFWDAFMKWKEKKIAQTPPLNLQDFPQFIHHPGIVTNLQRAIYDLMLLVFVNVLLFVMSFVAFVRYDVRSD